MSFAGIPTPEYVTRADLVAFYGEAEVASFDGQGLSLAGIIAAANAEIDSYVRRIEKNPLPEVPTALKMAGADIVRFRLYTNSSNPLYSERYQAAVKYLAAVAAGKVQLPVYTDEAATEQKPGSWASVSMEERAMTRDQFWAW